MAEVPVRELGTIRCMECGRLFTDVPLLPEPSGLCTCPGPGGYDPQNRYRKVRWEWTDGERDCLPPDAADHLDISEGHPVQIWRFDAEHLRFEATPGALECLQRFKAPVHSLAIFGDIRQGKSLLLNQLLGLLRDTASRRFHVDPNADSFTQGIWMWSEPLVYKGKTFAFFDFQGKEGEAGFDTEMLSLMMATTSECLVQQITTLHDPFVALEPIVSLIDMLQSRSDALVDPRIRDAAEQRGEHIDRALDRRSFLPACVRFLVRDCSARIRAQLPEKLRKILSVDPKEQETTRYAGRNETRQRIRDCIGRVEAFGVCRSADDGVLSSDDFHQVREDQLSPTFVQQVAELRELVLNTSEPKLIAGRPADGLSLLSQMHMIADLINDGFTSVAVPALKNRISDTITTAIQLGLAKYQEVAEATVGEHDDWHSQARQAGLDAFLEVCDQYRLSAYSASMGQTQLGPMFDAAGQQILIAAMQFARQDDEGGDDPEQAGAAEAAVAELASALQAAAAAAPAAAGPRRHADPAGGEPPAAAERMPLASG